MFKTFQTMSSSESDSESETLASDSGSRSESGSESYSGVEEGPVFVSFEPEPETPQSPESSGEHHLAPQRSMGEVPALSEPTSSPLGGGHVRQLSRGTHVSHLSGLRFSSLGVPGPLNGSESDQEGIRASALFDDGVTSALTPEAAGVAIGEEPGINAATTIVDLPGSVGSQVMIIDYSPSRLRISRLDVELQSSGHDLKQQLVLRPQWSEVRWVVVNGLSWEAIGPIANFYDLHPLALEDMLEIPQRTKMEIFSEQVFCCFPLHLLTKAKSPANIVHRLIRGTVRLGYRGLRGIYRQLRAIPIRTEKVATIGKQFLRKKRLEPNDIEIGAMSTAANPPHSSKTYVYSSAAATESSSGMSGSASTIPLKLRVKLEGKSLASEVSTKPIAPDEIVWDSIPASYAYQWGEEDGFGECIVQVNPEVTRQLARLPIRSMYQWNRGNDTLQANSLYNLQMAGTLQSSQVAIEQVSLFLLKDTVVTFFEKSAPAVYRPIVKRIENPRSMLRESSDPAILVQAIMDATVDLVAPISIEYRSRMSELQVAGIERPTLTHTHKLSGLLKDLSLLQGTVGSLASLVEALGSRSMRLARRIGRRRHYDGDDASTKGEFAREHQSVLTNAISEVAAMYFSDAADHALQYTQDMKMMRNHAKTLIVSLQNEISIRGGDAVAMLSLVTVVFLPLTFLTGYFGMNFTNFDLLDNDVSYYWLIAGPAGGGLAAILVYPVVIAMYTQITQWIRAQVQNM